MRKADKKICVWEDMSRNFRLLIRHIRFFRSWQSENKAKLKALEELFKVTNRFLQDLGVEYWLAYGTLLGYHREERILSHDQDIDFGAHEKEYDRIRGGRHNLPPGFKMHDTTRKHPGPKLYITYKGWEADIYFYEDMDSHLRCYLASTIQGDLEPVPKNYVYPLKEAIFLREKTVIPNQTEAYLLHLYGYIGENAEQDKKTGYWHSRDSKANI